VYSFELHLSSGERVEPVEEFHRQSDLLSRENQLLGPGDEIAGDVWFDVGRDEIQAVTFDTDAFDVLDEPAGSETQTVPKIAWELTP
jgi:hypothetical protein